MTRIGLVTGLVAEARLIGRGADTADGTPPLVACAGPGRGRAGAEQALDRGAEALVSFGLAGGLDPRCRAGTLVCPETVLAAGTRHATDGLWRGRLVAEARGTGLEIAEGVLLGRDDPVSGREDKQRLARETGALAVDMESHQVAGIAAERGVPFLALRAIADTADRAVPAAALAGLGVDGTLHALAVVLALCRSPGQIPATFALARDTRAAMAALGRAAGLRSLFLGLL